MQQPVAELLSLTPKLTSALEQSKMDRAVALLDSLSHPLALDDIAALMSLLPSDGDDALEVNWTILHWIEASPLWPVWDLLRENGNEWVDIFRIRLKNAGIAEA